MRGECEVFACYTLYLNVKSLEDLESVKFYIQFRRASSTSTPEVPYRNKFVIVANHFFSQLCFI